MSDTFGFNNDDNFGFDTGEDQDLTPNHYVVTEDKETVPASDFWGNAFDEDEVEQALKADLPPEGEYEVNGLQLEERENRFEAGVKELSCYGQGVNGEGRKATVRFSLEPKKRYKENGKVAWNYQLFKQALTAYTYSHDGQKPASSDDFTAYLGTATLRVRLVHATNGKGMNVMGIRGVK